MEDLSGQVARSGGASG